MNAVSKSCFHNNRLHNQAAPTPSCLTWGAVGRVRVIFFLRYFFFPPRLSPPQHSALFAFVCVWCVRTCDEKLYGLHPSERKLLPRPVCENCLAAPLEIETAAAISGFDGRRLTSR